MRLAPEAISHDPPPPQRREHLLRKHFRLLLPGGEYKLGLLGRLVGAADAGEVRELPRARKLVEAVGIARLANLERGVDINLDELVRADQRAPCAARRETAR
jgi:hypothetical protein